jgi:hypothetical protein
VTQNPQPDNQPAVARRLLRSLAVAAVIVVATAAPALAEPPESWEEPDNGSSLRTLLILAGIPLLLIVVISTLVVVPSLVRGQRHGSEVAWRDTSEWFGGPRKGVEAAPDQPAQDETKGGAGAQW